MSTVASCPLPPVQRVSGAGLQLAWREWNAEAPGTPLVLLHGITGSSADWQATAAFLAGHRVIALDARGHGQSEWDPDEAYAVDMHFADVATALDELALERCVLAGFSMGGGVSMLTAAALPERVAALAVIDAYPHPSQSPGSAGIARWVSTAAHTTRWFDPAISRHFRELLAAGMDTRADLRPVWEAVACPTVVVRGAESNVLPRHTAEDMLASLPHAWLATLTGVGHGIPFAKPRELAAILARLAAAAA